jgi:methyl-accepting chemotaxis protein
MKIKIKLSIIMIAIVVVIITVVAIILLNQASNISITLSNKAMETLAAQRASYWQGREDGLYRVARTLANIFADFEDDPPAERRSMYNSMMQSVARAETTIFQVYTVWLPNAVDGMDARFAGSPGNTATGQYATAFRMDNGVADLTVTTDIDDAMVYLNGPDAKAGKDRYEHPVPRNIDGKDTWYFRIMVPIINRRNGAVVGGVGCLCVIDAIQPTVENTIKTREDVAAAVIYSSNGFIIGH